MRCLKAELGKPDASGRCRPRVIPGSEHRVGADLVWVSYGFEPVPFPPGSDLHQIAPNAWGGIMPDQNQMTDLADVFAGGGAVRGANLVVHPVRDGRKAAQGIHSYLCTKRIIELGQARVDHLGGEAL